MRVRVPLLSTRSQKNDMRLPKRTKQLRLSPYPGIVLVTDDWDEFNKLSKKLLDRAHEEQGTRAGRFVAGSSPLHPHTAIVFWTTYATLAHEMAHVIFDLFEGIGIPDPGGCDNEPFCYLLSQLMTDTLESHETRYP